MAPLYQNGICTHWPTGIPFFPLKKRKRTLRTAGTRDRTPWFVTRGRQLRENSLPFRPRDNQLNDNDPVQRRLLPSFLSYFLLSSSKKALDWDVLLLFYFQRERERREFGSRPKRHPCAVLFGVHRSFRPDARPQHTHTFSSSTHTLRSDCFDQSPPTGRDSVRPRYLLDSTGQQQT